jgi:carbon-monoxide dehydrogenase iron sulfur subunit
LKRLVVKSELCVGCLLCQEVCPESWGKEKNSKKSAIKIEEDPEKGYKIAVCNQCGICIKICPVQALYRDQNGIVRVKKDICVGCLICVGECPHETMYYHDDFSAPYKCVVCGLCTEECPSGAITVEDY